MFCSLVPPAVQFTLVAEPTRRLAYPGVGGQVDHLTPGLVGSTTLLTCSMATSMATGDVDASPRGSMTQGDAESLSGRGGEDTSRGGGWTAEEWQAWYEARWWDGSATTGSQAGRQPEISWSDRHHSQKDLRTSTTAGSDPWGAWRDSWTNYRADGPGEERGGGADKIVVPEFSAEDDREGGKARGYLRKVEAWRRVTRIKPHKQALVLYNSLTGRAWRDAEELDMADLDCDSGVDHFIAWVTNRYLDKEVIKAGRYMSEFFKQFKRQAGQEIRDYNTEFDRHLGKLKEIGCALPGPCMAWWYVDKLRLDNASELNLLASVGNVYDLGRLQEAAVIQDRMNRRMWEHGKRTDYKEKKHGGHQAYLTGINEDSADEDLEDIENALDEEDLEPEEGDEQAQEAFVAFQNAKAKYNSIVKARGTSGPQSKEERLRIAKARSYCSACHQKGHWHKDPECPKNRDKGTAPHTTHVVFYTGGPTEAKLDAIVDCACSRTLAGIKWLKDYVKCARRHGVPYFVIQQNEVFKFGGPRLFPSTRAVVCWFCLKGKWWLLKVSAVSVDVPLLISRTALASLGTNYDIRENTADFLALELRQVELGFTSTGHPSLDVVSFAGAAPEYPEKIDWSLTEVFVNPIKTIGETDSNQCGEVYMASSLNRGWHRLFYPKIEEHLEELMVSEHFSGETFLNWWHQQHDMDRDFWIEREDVLVRIHVTPRRTFFDPRTWKTKDDVLKNQLLHELGDSRETTCVPCSRGVPVLNIQHIWRDEHGPRADSLWIGRSLFKRQVRQQFDPSSSPPSDEHCAYFTMEDEQGTVDPGFGGTTGGGPQGMDSSRTTCNVVGGTRTPRPDEAQAVGDFAPSPGPVEGEVSGGRPTSSREANSGSIDEDVEGQHPADGRGDGSLRQVQGLQIWRGARRLLGLGRGGSEGQCEPQPRLGEVGEVVATSKECNPWSWIVPWRPGGERGGATTASEEHPKEGTKVSEDEAVGQGGSGDIYGMVRGRGEHGGADQGSGSKAGSDEVHPRAGEEDGGKQEGDEHSQEGSTGIPGKSRSQLKKEYWERVGMLQKWKKELRRASKPEVRRASGPEEEGEIDGGYTREVYFTEDGSHCTVDYDDELEEIGDACFPKVNLKYPSDYEAVRNLPSKRMKRTSKKRVRGMARCW